jgi:hypothetical protein
LEVSAHNSKSKWNISRRTKLFLVGNYLFKSSNTNNHTILFQIIFICHHFHQIDALTTPPLILPSSTSSYFATNNFFHNLSHSTTNRQHQFSSNIDKLNSQILHTPNPLHAHDLDKLYLVDVNDPIALEMGNITIFSASIFWASSEIGTCSLSIK